MPYLLASDDFNPQTGQVLVISDGETGLVTTQDAGGSGDVNGPGLSTDNAVARFNGTNGKAIQNSLVTISDTGSVTASTANSGAGVLMSATNTSNTASSTAGFVASVGGSSAGDPYMQFVSTGEQTWTAGLDNSVGGNPFVIAASATLGTSNALSITSAGAGTFTGGVTATAGAITATNGNLVLGTAGNKLVIPGGANASIGTTTAMVGGTITVSTTAVTSSSIIFLTYNTPAGVTGQLSAPSGSITPGVSFVINSSSGTDTSTVNWWLLN